MAGITVEQLALIDDRFGVLKKLAGLADDDHARGKMIRVWNACLTRQSYTLPGVVVDAAAGLDGFAEAVADAGLAERIDGSYRIRGTAGRIEWLGKCRAASAKGGEATKAKWVELASSTPPAQPEAERPSPQRPDGPTLEGRSAQKQKAERTPKSGPKEGPSASASASASISLSSLSPSSSNVERARAPLVEPEESREPDPEPETAGAGSWRVMRVETTDPGDWVWIDLPIDDFRQAPPPSGGTPFTLPCPECGQGEQPAIRIRKISEEKGRVRVRLCDSPTCREERGCARTA